MWLSDWLSFAVARCLLSLQEAKRGLQLQCSPVRSPKSWSVVHPLGISRLTKRAVLDAVQRSRRLVNAAWSQSPSGYGITYFAMIPFFAFLYWKVCPNEFRMSTATSETAYVGVLKTAGEMLQAQLRSTFRYGHQRRQKVSIPNCIDGAPCELDGASIEVHNTGFRGDALSFSIRFTLGDGHNFGSFGMIVVHENWSRSASPFPPEAQLAGPFVPDTVRLDAFRVLNGTQAEIAERLAAAVIFPHRSPVADSELFFVPLNLPLVGYIDAAYGAHSGLVGQLPGKAVRMFYLSAVTITTLGYGDIVPTSSTARLLVSLEAILGILVAGLFLNSLAKATGRASVEPPRTD